MKIKRPFVGILAFSIVLLTMPLGHACMILMEKIFSHSFLYKGAFILGILGIIFLIAGSFVKNRNRATIAGLFSGLLVWTGWIEFSYVYISRRHNIAPLIENGEIVTKPEYLLLPSSIGFLAVLFIYFLFSANTRCVFLGWFQDKFRLKKKENIKSSGNNPALSTFIELISVLWTFYIVLLLVYDEQLFGDKHPVTYFVAFGSLFWSLYLFSRLVKIGDVGYAIRYAIPTVIIFWNFIEVLGRWNMLREIWIEPSLYWGEMLIITFILILLTVLFYFEKKIILKITNRK
jgi:hypothetical protein